MQDEIKKFIHDLEVFELDCIEAQYTDVGELWTYADQAKKLLIDAAEKLADQDDELNKN